MLRWIADSLHFSERISYQVRLKIETARSACLGVRTQCCWNVATEDCVMSVQWGCWKEREPVRSVALNSKKSFNFNTTRTKVMRRSLPWLTSLTKKSPNNSINLFRMSLLRLKNQALRDLSRLRLLYINTRQSSHKKWSSMNHWDRLFRSSQLNQEQKMHLKSQRMKKKRRAHRLGNSLPKWRFCQCWTNILEVMWATRVLGVLSHLRCYSTDAPNSSCILGMMWDITDSSLPLI